jgi:hypothetical protein
MGDMEWARLSDDELLKMRICDLKLTIEGSELEPRVARLFDELQAKGLAFRPDVYLGDEWFSPEGVPAIAIPFYLAHPRLIALETKMMLDAEGEEFEHGMRLLRHESGHCFDHAYRFSRRTKWRKVFGSPESEYTPETYRPRPYSKSFVRHLENWYAQAHPDEDFAETFAVWLDPALDWKKTYSKWPVALAKLQYIDSLAHEVLTRKAKIEAGSRPYAASRLKSTLGAYYARKKRENAEQYPDFFDKDLLRIFNGSEELVKRDFGAARFMKRNRRIIVDSVSRWTGERKFTIGALLKRLEERCEKLGLKMGRGESETSLELASYLATLVTHHLFTGKFQRNF